MADKTCIKCGKVKPTDDFPASRNQCHDCKAAHARQYREAKAAGALAEWQAANRNLKLAGKTCRECGLSNVDFIATANLCVICNRDRARAYYRDNADKANARSRAYRAENREQYNHRAAQRAAQHRAENPDVANDAYRRRRAANLDAFRVREQESRVRRRESINAYRRVYRKAHPEQQASKEARVQRETLASATRWNFVWAGWEIELISDGSRTARSLAVQLGRTRAAVSQMRHLIRHDPQTIQRAGLSESGHL